MTSPLQAKQMLRVSFDESNSSQGEVRTISPSEAIVTLTDVDCTKLTVGTPLMVAFWNHDGLHHARVDLLRVIGPREIAITIPPETSALERRAFFRVRLSAPISLEVVESADEDRIGMTDAAAMMKDISGGGLRADTALKLEVGDRVRIVADVDHVTLLSAIEAIVRRTQPRSDGRFDAGVQFEFANTGQQDRVVRAVFRLQLHHARARG